MIKSLLPFLLGLLHPPQCAGFAWHSVLKTSQSAYYLWLVHRPLMSGYTTNVPPWPMLKH